MEKIKSISLFGTLPPIKGISGFCIEQAQCLSKKFNVEFNSFSSLYPDFLYPGGTKEHSEMFSIKENDTLKIKRGLAWYNPLSWIYAGLTSRGDFVHINWWIYILFPAFFTIAVLSKLRGKKVVLTLHNVTAHESNFLDWILSSIMYKTADILLVHTENSKNALINKFKINENKISVIPYGPLNFYKTKSITRSEAKIYLGLTDENKTILFFGTIRKYKGLDILMQAFARITKKFPEARLIIAGKNWTDWRPYLNLIDKLNIQKKIVTHIKYIPSEEVQYYFTAADVVILPYTDIDSQSAVASIAAAFDTPILTSSGNNDVKELSKLIKTFFFSKNNENVNKPSWDTYLEKYLEVTQNLKNSYKLLVTCVTLVLLMVLGIGLFRYINSSPTAKRFIILATTVQPETFTELYFENHLELPSKVALKEKYTFAFTIHNLENKDMAYPYEVYIASDESKLNLISSGSATIKKDGYKTIPKDFTLELPLGRVKVVVNLINKNQKIDFWIENL